MKTKMRTLLVLGALITGTTLYAKDTTNTQTENHGKITPVRFEHVNKGAKLYLRDSKGQIIFTERIKENGLLTRKFDLSQLPEAEYYFEIDMAEALSVYPFYVGKENVTLLHEQSRTISKPDIRLKGEQVFITYDSDNEQSLKIDILFEGEDIAFSESLDKNGKVERIYDFSTSISGDYLFKIQASDRTFSEYVTIKTDNR